MVSPELLRRYRFFGGLTPDEVVSVAMLADEVSYPDGAVIFRDGDPATHLFLLTAGCVELVHHINGGTNGQPVQVGSIPAGEPFGVSAFVEPYRMTANAVCQGAVTAVAIDAKALREMAEAQCHLGYAIMCQIAAILAERLSYSRVQLAACRPW